MAAPVVVLAYYDDLPGLALAVERAHLPPVPVYYGNYARSLSPTPNPNVGSAPPRKMPYGRPAPMFELHPTRFWLGRDPAVTSALGGDGRLAGALPPVSAILALPVVERRNWGVELGRRFRDHLRDPSGRRPHRWQFDEIPGQVAAANGGPMREFVAAILQGLAHGRPELGDPVDRGFVWIARSALRVAAQPAVGELAAFWDVVDDAATAIVGEEYVDFAGDPRETARAGAAGQQALAGGTGPRVRLARRYLAGLTPGYRLRPALGGNVNHQPREWVNQWRLDYIRERAASGVAGFAMYNFRFENSAEWVMDDALNAVALGTRLLLHHPS